MVILTMKTSWENGERKPASRQIGNSWDIGSENGRDIPPNSNFNVENAVTNAVVTYEIWG